MFAKRPPDRHVDLRADTAGSLLRIRNPETQIEIYTTVGKGGEQRLRRRVGEHSRRHLRRLAHQAHCQIEVGTIGNLNRDRYAQP